MRKQSWNNRHIMFIKCLLYAIITLNIIRAANDSTSTSVICFDGCKTCSGSAYSDCLTCFSGRGEISSNKAVYSSCFCQPNLEETFDETCQDKSVAYSAVNTILTTILITLISCIVILAIAGNHLIPFLLYDSFQTIGYLRLINIIYPGNLDNVFDSLQNLNINVILGKLSTSQPSDQEITEPATKLVYIGYSHSFLFNMQTLLVIYGSIFLVLLIFVLFHHHHRRKHGVLYLINQKRFTIIVRLFTVTICEVFLSILMQFRQFSFSNAFNGISFIIAVLSLAGICALVIYVIVSINYSILIYQMVNRKYNTYFDRLKSKDVFNRNIIVIQLSVKILFISFVIVGTQSPIIGLSCLLALYTVYGIAITLFARLTKRRFLALYLTLCFSISLLNLILLIYANYSSDPSQNKSTLITLEWVFIVILLVSLVASTLYALAEVISNLPIVLAQFSKAIQYFKNINKPDEDDNNVDCDHGAEDTEGADKKSRSFSVKKTASEASFMNNLDVPLAIRRKAAVRRKKLESNKSNGEQAGEWVQNPIFDQKEQDYAVHEKKFQEQINFELSNIQKNLNSSSISNSEL